MATDYRVARALIVSQSRKGVTPAATPMQNTSETVESRQRANDTANAAATANSPTMIVMYVMASAVLELKATSRNSIKLPARLIRQVRMPTTIRVAPCGRSSACLGVTTVTTQVCMSSMAGGKRLSCTLSAGVAVSLVAGDLRAVGAGEDGEDRRVLVEHAEPGLLDVDRDDLARQCAPAPSRARTLVVDVRALRPVEPFCSARRLSASSRGVEGLWTRL